MESRLIDPDPKLRLRLPSMSLEECEEALKKMEKSFFLVCDNGDDQVIKLFEARCFHYKYRINKFIKNRGRIAKELERLYERRFPDLILDVKAFKTQTLKPTIQSVENTLKPTLSASASKEISEVRASRPKKQFRRWPQSVQRERYFKSISRQCLYALLQNDAPHWNLQHLFYHKETYTEVDLRRLFSTEYIADYTNVDSLHTLFELCLSGGPSISCNTIFDKSVQTVDGDTFQRHKVDANCIPDPLVLECDFISPLSIRYPASINVRPEHSQYGSCGCDGTETSVSIPLYFNEDAKNLHNQIVGLIVYTIMEIIDYIFWRLRDILFAIFEFWRLKH